MYVTLKLSIPNGISREKVFIIFEKLKLTLPTLFKVGGLRTVPSFNANVTCTYHKMYLFTDSFVLKQEAITYKKDVCCIIA